MFKLRLREVASSDMSSSVSPSEWRRTTDFNAPWDWLERPKFDFVPLDEDSAATAATTPPSDNAGNDEVQFLLNEDEDEDMILSFLFDDDEFVCRLADEAEGEDELARDVEEEDVHGQALTTPSPR